MSERVLEWLISADTRRFDRGVSKSVQKLRILENQAKETAKKSALIFAGAVAGAGVAVKSFSDFEYQMAKVKAISGATDKDFKILKNTAQRLGATTEHSATAAAQGLEFLALAGYSAKQAIDALPATLNLATVAGIELGQAADMVTDVMSQFGLKAKKTGQAVDVFTKISQTANTSVAQLGAAIINSGTEAKSFQMSLEDTSAILAIFANQGIKGEEAGTKLKRMLIDLGNNSDKLKQFGIEVYKADGSLNSLNNVFEQFKQATKGVTKKQEELIYRTAGGTKSVQALKLALNEGAGSYAAYQRAANNAAGASKGFVEALSETTVHKMNSFKSALEAVFIAIGEKLAPAFKAILDGATDLLKSFSKLSSGTKDLITKTGAIVAVFFGLKTIISLVAIGYSIARQTIIKFTASTVASGNAAKVATGKFRILNTVMRANPIALIISVIGTLATSFGVFGKETDKATKSVNKFNQELETMRRKNKGVSDEILKQKTAEDIVQKEYDETNSKILKRNANLSQTVKLTKESAQALREEITEQKKSVALTRDDEIENLKKLRRELTEVNILKQNSESNRQFKKTNGKSTAQIKTEIINLNNLILLSETRIKQTKEQILTLDKQSQSVGGALTRSIKARKEEAKVFADNQRKIAADKLKQQQEEQQKVDDLIAKIQNKNSAEINLEKQKLIEIRTQRENDQAIRQAIIDGASKQEIRAMKEIFEIKKQIMSQTSSLEQEKLKVTEDSNKQIVELEKAIENAKTEQQKVALQEQIINVRENQKQKLDLIDEQNQAEQAKLYDNLEKQKELLRISQSETIEWTAKYQALLDSMGEEEKLAHIQSNLDKYNSDERLRALTIVGEIKKKQILAKLKDEERKDEIKKETKFLIDKKKHGKIFAQMQDFFRSEEVKNVEKTNKYLIDLQNSKNKDDKAIGKVAALTQIAIDTARGVLKAYADLGPILGTAAAAAIVAMGTEKAAKVRAANKGGIVTGVNTGRDTEPFLLTPGEVILPADTTQALVSTFKTMREQKNETGSINPNIQVNIEFTGDLSGLAEVITPEITIEQEKRGVSNI